MNVIYDLGQDAHKTHCLTPFRKVRYVLAPFKLIARTRLAGVAVAYGRKEEGGWGGFRCTALHYTSCVAFRDLQVSKCMDEATSSGGVVVDGKSRVAQTGAFHRRLQNNRMSLCL